LFTSTTHLEMKMLSVLFFL